MLLHYAIICHNVNKTLIVMQEQLDFIKNMASSQKYHGEIRL